MLCISYMPDSIQDARKAEMMMSSKGIGLMLSQAREIGGINEVTAVMLVIIMISMVIDKLIFGLIEKHACRWQ